VISLRPLKQVEGVYEMQTPLILRAVMSIGCLARLSKGVAVRSNLPYSMSEIEHVDERTSLYLPFEKDRGGTDKLRKIYLYRMADSIRGGGGDSARGIMAVFIVDSQNDDSGHTDTDSPEKKETRQDHSSEVASQLRGFTARGFLWLINPAGGNAVDMPPFKRIFRKFCLDPASQCKIIGNYVKTMSEATALCDERLAQLTAERRGPLIFVAQGTVGYYTIMYFTQIMK